MHIVYVTGRFAKRNGDVLGGMPFYIYKISKYMQEKGHDVTILSIGNEKKKWKYKEIPVYSEKLPEICYFANKLTEYILLPVIREIVFNRALRRINKEHQISIVQYAGWYGVGMLYNRAFPSVLRISSYAKVQLPLSYTAFELAVISFEERIAARNFNGIVSPSKALGNAYGAETNRKISVIETPYYTADAIREDDTLYKKKLENKKYFLFFGRISPDKGLNTIARVLKQILNKYPEHDFCFAGDIFMREKENIMQNIQKSAGIYSNRVKYLGSLSHEKLYPIIRNAECIVMPSLMDNLPNACMEALELNGIVIGTRGASFDEVFEDGVSGLLIDIDDSDALLEKINYVMQMTTNDKEQMRRNAIRCLNKYKPEIAGDKLEKYYFKIISLWKRNRES